MFVCVTVCLSPAISNIFETSVARQCDTPGGRFADCHPNPDPTYGENVVKHQPTSLCRPELNSY